MQRFVAFVKKYWSDYIFLLPNFLGVSLFIIFPFFFAFYLGFFEWDVFRPPEFIGLENYRQLLFEDSLFWQSLWNTLIYVAISIPVGIVVALAAAVLMNQQIRGIAFFRTAMLVPVVSSMIAVGVVWRWVYARDYGLINSFLAFFGITGPGWLSESAFALAALALMAVWKNFGFNALILLAALQGVPTSLYEAAALDGANGWQLFRNVSLPMIAPAILFVIIISIIGSFQVFDQVFVMTQGGPGRATYVYNYYLYIKAFQQFHMGYASAMAYILFGIVFSITYLQFKLGERYAMAAYE